MAVDVCLLWLLCCLVTLPQVSSNSEVTEGQQKIFVKPPNPITIRCANDEVPIIDRCIWHVKANTYYLNRPNGVVVSLEDNNSTCVIEKPYSNDDDSGRWHCHLNRKNAQTFNVIVIKKPRDPRITVDGKLETPVRIGDSKKPNITCQVDKGRPEAHMSMYLTKASRSVPLHITTWDHRYRPDREDSTFKSVASWNVPKHEELVKYDGWTLGCKAKHKGYPEGEKVTTVLLDVLYKPSFQFAQEQYRGVLGKVLKVFIRFTANPRPKTNEIELQITQVNKKITMRAGTRTFGNGSYTLGYSQKVQGAAHAYDVVIVVNTLQKEHTAYKHKLTVRNSQGDETYDFSLTNKPFVPVAQPWLSKFEHVLGVSIAGGVLLLLVFVLVMSAVCFMRRRKVKNRQDENVIRKHSKSRKDYPTYSRYDSIGNPEDEGGSFADALGETHRNMMAGRLLRNGNVFHHKHSNSRDKDDEIDRDRDYRESLETRKNDTDPENEIAMEQQQPRRSISIHIERDSKKKRTAMDVFTECLFS